jgi:hypothetical protein
MVTATTRTRPSARRDPKQTRKVRKVDDHRHQPHHRWYPDPVGRADRSRVLPARRCRALPCGADGPRHGRGQGRGLQPFAERFSREGFAVVAIDYRRWGGSTGQPRDEALAAIPQCAQNAMSGTTYSHSTHSTGSSGLMASCSSCRSAACSTVGRAIRASPPTMGRARATGPDASCGASRVTVAAAVKRAPPATQS